MINGCNSSSVIYSNTINITSLYTLYQKLNTPFADYESMQYFVEKVK